MPGFLMQVSMQDQITDPFPNAAVVTSIPEAPPAPPPAADPEAKAPTPEAKEQPQGRDDATEQDADGEQPKEPGEDRPKRPGVPQRIAEITREKHEARRAAEEAKREAEFWRQQALRGQSQPEQPKQTQADPDAPRVEQFDDYADFVKASIAYGVQKELQKRDADQAAKQRATAFEQRQKAVADEVEDFYDVIAATDLPVTPAMSEVIVESEIGPKLAYHLAKNPEEHRRIAALQPLAAAREMGRLEARLLAESKPADPTANAPAPRTVTRAPEPIKPLTGGHAPKAPNPDEMTFAEFEAWRRKGGGR